MTDLEGALRARFGTFAKPSANGRCLREAVGRRAVLNVRFWDRSMTAERPSWVDSGPSNHGSKARQFA
jgi:hypothetical protein